MELITHHRGKITIFLIVASLLFYIGVTRQTISEEMFVGKWKSSKLTTPLYLRANGDWEIKQDDGTVLQYGIWEYKNKKITWSYKVGSSIGHDINPVLSITSNEFSVMEGDESTTSFTRYE